MRNFSERRCVRDGEGAVISNKSKYVLSKWCLFSSAYPGNMVLNSITAATKQVQVH